jgi:UDP-perosamine 4-acetyltransferase
MAGALLVFGSGGHAKVVVEAALARDPGRRIVLLDDDPGRAGQTVLGIAIAGGSDWLAANEPGAPVALGVGRNADRARLMARLAGQGHTLETVIHPSAVVSPSARIEAGAFVAAGAIVTAEASIGRGAIVNTAASVDHDCRLGEAVHVAPGTRLCGNVTVGDRSLIGAGSVVRPGVTIGADVCIGIGSAVIADLADGARVAGTPARPIGPARTPC